MIIVIDAYNLLKRIFSGREISDKQAHQFIADLAGYAKKKHHKIKVFFDGGPMSFATQEHHGHVTVIHAGHQQSADDAIVQYLFDKQGKEIVLVTADREIADNAPTHVDVIDPELFYQLMHQDDLQVLCDKQVHSTDCVHKLPHDSQEHSDAELDALMEQASRVVIKKAEDQVQEIAISHRTLSKSERRIAKKIAKL